MDAYLIDFFTLPKQFSVRSSVVLIPAFVTLQARAGDKNPHISAQMTLKWVGFGLFGVGTANAVSLHVNLDAVFKELS